jgi:hypothetical protein
MSIVILRLDARDLNLATSEIAFDFWTLLSLSIHTRQTSPSIPLPSGHFRRTAQSDWYRAASQHTGVRKMHTVVNTASQKCHFFPPTITLCDIQVETCAKTSKNAFGAIKYSSFLFEKLQILELQVRSDESCYLSNVESWMECKELLYHCVQQCFSRSDTPFLLCSRPSHLNCFIP